MFTRFISALLLVLVLPLSLARAADAPANERHLLYVASPGVRDLLEYGGHGLLVFDIDHDHQFVKRIPTVGLNPSTGKPSNVKGICANAKTGRLYISVLHSLTCIDLATEDTRQPYGQADMAKQQHRYFIPWNRLTTPAAIGRPGRGHR